MNKKVNRKKIFYTIIILCLFVLLMARLTMLLNKKAEQQEEMDKKLAEIQMDIDELREKNSQLRKRIELLEEGPYIEKVAREQLGMVKEDEVALIKLGEEKNKEDITVDSKKNKEAKKSLSTFELCKKNIAEFFGNIFKTISIKEQ